jgi:hypothetical protein
VGDAWQATYGHKLLGWVEHEFHQDGRHAAILRQPEGLTQDDIGLMPQVYGGLARSDG